MANLYSFPPIKNSDECKKFSDIFLNYPFTEHPNLIGITALVEDGGIPSKCICSYNYLCPYNIIATYSLNNNNNFTLLNINNDIAITKYNKKIRHQVIDFLSNNGNGEIGEIVVSGEHLYHQYSGTTCSTVCNEITVEYLSDEFEKIFEISNGAFHDTSIDTVKFPYNSIDDDIGFYGLIIGDNAFSGCSELKEFYCYHGIKKVGKKAFCNCTSLSGNEISCDGSISVIGSTDDYYDDGNYNYNCRLSAATSTLGGLKVCFDCEEESFKDCSSITNLYFFDGKSQKDYGGSGNLKNALSINVLTFSAQGQTYGVADALQFYDKPSTPIPIYYGENNGQNRSIENTKYKIMASAFTNCQLSEINGYIISVQRDNNYNIETDLRNFEPMAGLEYWTSCDYEKTQPTYSYVIPKCLDLTNATAAFANCGISGVLYFENINENVKLAKGIFSNNSISGLDKISGNKILSSNIDDGAFYQCGIANANKETQLQNIADIDSTRTLAGEVSRIFETQP